MSPAGTRRNALQARARRAAAVTLARALGPAARRLSFGGARAAYKYVGALTTLRGERVVVAVPGGGRVEVDAFDPYWAPYLLGGCAYEPEVHAVLRRFAPLRPRFIDGGANVGYWSAVCLGGALCRPGVLAVEPSPATFAALERTAALNPGMVPVRAALSERSGQTVFLELLEYHAMTRVGARSGVAVTTVTIDDLLEQHDVGAEEPIVVKLDIEGHELDALRGATRLMQREHALIVEDFDRNAWRNAAWLLDRGERVWYVDTRGRAAPVADVSTVAALAAADGGKPEESRNVVAVLPGGALDALLRAGR